MQRTAESPYHNCMRLVQGCSSDKPGEVRPGLAHLDSCRNSDLPMLLQKCNSHRATDHSVGFRASGSVRPSQVTVSEVPSIMWDHGQLFRISHDRTLHTHLVRPVASDTCSKVDSWGLEVAPYLGECLLSKVAVNCATASLPGWP